MTDSTIPRSPSGSDGSRSFLPRGARAELAAGGGHVGRSERTIASRVREWGSLASAGVPMPSCLCRTCRPVNLGALPRVGA